MGEKVEAEDVEITTSVISQQPNVVVVQPGRPLPGGIDERVETFFSLRMRHHAGRPTTDNW